MQLNNLLFKRIPNTTLCLLRIGIGLVIFLSFLNDFPHLTAYYSDQGYFGGKIEVLRDDFRFSLLDYFSSPLEVSILYSLLLISLLGLIQGRFAQPFAIFSFILLASFHERNTLLLNSGDTLMRLLLFYLIFVPSSWYEKNKKIPVWPLRAIQLQLCIVYLFAFLSKTGATWKDGTALYYFLTNDYFARFDFTFLSEFMIVIAVLTYASLVIEIGFPFLIWFSLLRPYVNWLGVLLQLGILFSVNIMFFSLIMLVAHISFMNPVKVKKRIVTMHSLIISGSKGI